LGDNFFVFLVRNCANNWIKKGNKKEFTKKRVKEGFMKRQVTLCKEYKIIDKELAIQQPIVVNAIFLEDQL
jgi:hypothetical protein